MKSTELLRLLTSVVTGLLTKTQTTTEGEIFRYLVRVMEQAARFLLDNGKSKSDEDLTVKLLEFVRLSYRTCLNLILEGSDEAEGS